MPTKISFDVIDVCLLEDAERPETSGAKLRLSRILRATMRYNCKNRMKD